MITVTHIQDHRTHLTFQLIHSDEDMDELLDEDNHDDDEFLEKFAHLETFNNKTWDDLTPVDIMVMILTHCSELNNIDGDERFAMFGEDSEFMANLSMLIMRYANSLQEFTGMYNERLVLQILGDGKVSFRTELSMILSLEKPLVMTPPQKPNGLKIVVDNED